jgi:S1-C subfamily serine protease
MAPNFVAKSTIRSGDFLTIDGVSVIDRFHVLRDFVISQAGRDAAALFAEPIITRKGAEAEIAWYTERQGEPVALPALDADARRTVGDRLRNHLAALEPLLRDPEMGRVVAGALYVPTPEDILAVGLEPTLIGWGVATDQSDAALAAQFDRTLGPYVPFRAPRIRAAPPSVVVRPAATIETPAPITAPRPKARWEAPSRGLYVATGVAALLALALTLPSVLASKPVAADYGDDLAALQKITQAMADKVEQAKAALAAATCTPNGALTPPTDDHAQLPPPPIPVKPQEGRAEGDMALVAERATQSVVFVFTCTDRAGWEEEHKDDKDKEKHQPLGCPFPAMNAPAADAQSSAELFFSGSGSGFFVGPNAVVTNSHVVKDAKSVYVTSRYLGRVQPGKVLAATVKKYLDDPDFAAIQVDIDHPPPEIPLATSVGRLQNVVSAGFPGVVTYEADAAIERLKHGDAQAAPEVITFPGFVTLILKPDADLPLIISSAVIGHGNSGGPLFDLCARAVGMNTLGWSGEAEDSGYKVNAAEAAKGLMAFLDANHISYQKATDACAPTMAKADTPAPKSDAPKPDAPKSDAPKPNAPKPNSPPPGDAPTPSK